MEYINRYISKNKERFINELIELLKIPSISADSNYAKEVQYCAEAVKESLINAGLNKYALL